MNAGLAAIAPKLQKLIPRLASDHDGEVVATVAAIRRTLEAAGLDLHDLTAALVIVEPTPPAQIDGPEMLRQVIETPDFAPSDWERSFLAGCMRRVRQKGALTPKQAEVLREIYLRECA